MNYLIPQIPQHRARVCFSLHTWFQAHLSPASLEHLFVALFNITHDNDAAFWNTTCCHVYALQNKKRTHWSGASFLMCLCVCVFLCVHAAVIISWVIWILNLSFRRACRTPQILVYPAKHKKQKSCSFSHFYQTAGSICHEDVEICSPSMWGSIH